MYTGFLGWGIREAMTTQPKNKNKIACSGLQSILTVRVCLVTIRISPCRVWISQYVITQCIVGVTRSTLVTKWPSLIVTISAIHPPLIFWTKRRFSTTSLLKITLAVSTSTNCACLFKPGWAEVAAITFRNTLKKWYQLKHHQKKPMDFQPLTKTSISSFAYNTLILKNRH